MHLIVSAVICLLVAGQVTSQLGQNKDEKTETEKTSNSSVITSTTPSTVLGSTADKGLGTNVASVDAKNKTDSDSKNRTPISGTTKGNSSEELSKEIEHGSNNQNSTDSGGVSGTSVTVISTTVATDIDSTTEMVDNVENATDAMTGNTTVRPEPNVIDENATMTSNSTDVMATSPPSNETDTVELDVSTTTQSIMNETESDNNTIANNKTEGGDLDVTTVLPEVNDTAGVQNPEVADNSTTLIMTTQSVNDNNTTAAESNSSDGTTRDNKTKDQKTPHPDENKSTSTAAAVTDKELKPKAKTSPRPSTKDVSTVSANSIVDEKQNHAKSKRLALGIVIPCLIALVLFGIVLAYRKLKKKGRGYITLDDLGNFQGMNNPNYDPEL